MDSVTTAIVNGIMANLPTALASTLAAPVALDAWKNFKNLLLRKLGPASRLPESIRQLEEKPESPGRRLVVQEEVHSSGIDKDDEVLAAAKTLLDLLKNAGSSSSGIVVVGNGNAVANNGSMAVIGNVSGNISLT